MQVANGSSAIIYLTDDEKYDWDHHEYGEVYDDNDENDEDNDEDIDAEADDKI